jgi:hypothetical protein
MKDVPFFTPEDQAILDEFAEADRLYCEHAEELYKRRKAAAKAVLALFQAGTHWQDSQGVVYRVELREQAIVDLCPTEIKRTQRKVGETYVLARKTAEELGYQPFKPEKPKQEGDGK